jgi:hypothetical protein
MSSVNSFNLSGLEQILQGALVERKQLLLSVVIVVLGVLVAVVGAWPLWQRIQSSQASLRKLQTQVNKDAQRLRVLESANAQDSGNFDLMALALPEFKQPLSNMITLGEIASRSGVVIVEYNLSPGVVSTDSAETQVTGKSGTDAFTFQVTMQGNLDQVKQAFAEIETSLPLMEISRFDLSRNAKEEEEDLYRTEITLVTRFIKLDPTEIAKQPAAALSAEQQSLLDTLRSFHAPGEGTKFTPQQYENQQLFGAGE